MDVDSNLPVSVTFHKDFNFEDGDIIISAKGLLRDPRDGLQLPSPDVGRVGQSRPKDLVHFRLHKFTLCRHSSTLSDVLAVPRGRTQVETLFGLPVVHLHDNVRDLVKLFDILYHPEKVPHKPLRRITYDVLLPVLVLADKYDMPRLLEAYLPRIQADWPMALMKWDDIERQIEAMYKYFDQLMKEASGLDYLNDFLAEPACVIRFGRTAQVPEVLPAAFYHLSRLPTLFDKESYEDRMDFETWHDYYLRGGRSADRNLLHAMDYETLVVGQGAIRDWVTDLELGFTYEAAILDFPVCSEPVTNCIGVEGRWRRDISPLVAKILTQTAIDPLKGLQNIIDGLKKMDDPCEYCHKCIGGFLSASRNDFWKHLPSFFRLADPPEWGDEYRAEYLS